MEPGTFCMEKEGDHIAHAEFLVHPSWREEDHVFLGSRLKPTTSIIRRAVGKTIQTVTSKMNKSEFAIHAKSLQEI